MKRIIQTGIVIGAAFALWQVSADARFLDLKKQQQAPAPEVVPTPVPPMTPPNPSYKSQTQPDGISLRFENLSLIHVLRNIQEETGILFSVDPSLETVPFSATVQADNWEAAVRELLQGFSRVEVWTENLSASRIWILSGQGDTQEPVQPNANIRLSRPSQPKAQPSVSRKPRFQVSPSPATKPAPAPVAKAKLKIENLPPHILFEPGVLTFFKAKGIALPEKVKNMFGPNLEGLPANMPISPHILNDATFKGFLESNGLQVPKA